MGMLFLSSNMPFSWLITLGDWLPIICTSSGGRNFNVCMVLYVLPDPDSHFNAKLRGEA